MILTDTRFNNDVLRYLVENNFFVWGSLSGVCRRTRAVSSKCFSEVNQAILRTFSASISEFDQTTLPNLNPIRVFMRLMNQLHDRAQWLNCDHPFPEDLSHAERVTWEVVQSAELIKEVQGQMEIAQAHDFEIFVKEVALKLGIPFPAGTDSKAVWEDFKKDERIQQIEEFSLFKKGVKFLPSEIASLTNLKKLFLGSNQLRGFPPEFFSLSKLEILDLSHNQLAKLQPEFSSLVNLQHLRLNGNQLTNIPSQLASSLKLKYLDLSQNPLAKEEQELPPFPNLKFLYLNKVQIPKLPRGLNALNSLTELYLNDNQLTDVSSTHLPHTAWRRLFLLNNPLTLISKQCLTNLQDQLKNSAVRFGNRS